MFHRRGLSFVLFLSAVVLAGTATESCRAEDLPPLEKEAAKKISYTDDVWPIIKENCWGCHSGVNPKGGLSMDTVEEMLDGGESGALFEPGQPDASLLFFMVTGEEPAMPKEQEPLSVEEIQTLRQWIFAGAKDDSDGNLANRMRVVIPETYQRPPAVSSIALSSDGQRLAAACRSEVVLVDLFEKNKNKSTRRLTTQSDLLTHVEFSPDGQLLAAVGGSPSRYGEVRFFNAETGKLQSSRRIGQDTLFRGDFAPDGEAIALGGADGAVHIVPVDKKAKPRAFDLHSDWIMDVAYTPDGEMLVTGGRDKATKVSSVKTGELLRSVDSSSELISSVAADGRFAVAAGRARTLRSYTFKIALSGIKTTGAGNGARPIRKKGQYTKNFQRQPGEVYDIASSGDHKRIAVAGTWGDVRLYRIADRKRLAVVKPVPAPVYSIALNADGTRLAVGSKSGEVRLYALPDGKLLESFIPVPVQGNQESVATK